MDGYDYEPRIDENFWGINLSVYRKPELYLELCETRPYAPDGTSPLIFMKLGIFHIMFENKRIYNYLYKRKFGCELDWDYIDKYNQCR